MRVVTSQPQLKDLSSLETPAPFEAPTMETIVKRRLKRDDDILKMTAKEVLAE